LRQLNAKRDANEPEIVKALRKHGATVQPLSVGGVPDLLVGYMGVNLLFEVKSDKGTLTEDQKVWHENWIGQKTIVHNPAEALVYLHALDYLRPK